MRSYYSGATNDPYWLNGITRLSFAVVLFVSIVANAQSVGESQFRIRKQSLADGLDRFSEQSGLQILYDQAQIKDKHAQHLAGTMPVEVALDRLLAGTGLRWTYVNPHTVVVAPPRHTLPRRRNELLHLPLQLPTPARSPVSV